RPLEPRHGRRARPRLAPEVRIAVFRDAPGDRGPPRLGARLAERSDTQAYDERYHLSRGCPVPRPTGAEFSRRFFAPTRARERGKLSLGATRAHPRRLDGAKIAAEPGGARRHRACFVLLTVTTARTHRERKRREMKAFQGDAHDPNTTPCAPRR